VPIDDPRVRDELTRYLSDQWKPIIEKDVDGGNALPLRIEAVFENFPVVNFQVFYHGGSKVIRC
jgi:hypothetical protein